MDDPWADTPSTPIGSTPRVSLDTPKHYTESESFTEPKPTTIGIEETGDIDAYEQDVSSIPAFQEEPGNGNGNEDGDGFDDFDDFDEPAEAGPSTFTTDQGDGDGDGGFGDFGDFEEGDFGQEVEQQPIPEVMSTNQWSALNLRPLPTRSELTQQLSGILAPLLPSIPLGGDGVRSVGGLSQVMVGESSRDAYAQLTTAPILKPLDWTRSRVRREHLISMGVPVNLDEVDSHRISALPPLRITTAEGRRTASLDVDVNGGGGKRDKGKAREEGPRSAAPSNGGDKGKYGLGRKPDFDTSKAEELCGLEEDRLSLLPLTTLRKIQDELVTTSAQASAALAWGLQLKDAQTHDSTTYNGMISELISNAAKAKSAQSTGSGVFRRSSQKVRPASTTVSPRVGSPAMR